MTMACYLDDRPGVAELMRLFAQGCGGKLVDRDTPDPDADDHVVVAKTQRCKLVPKFRRRDLAFWYIDSAYIQIAGRREYRIERNAYWPPMLIGEHTMDRATAMGVKLKPWQTEGSHVLLCLPGPMAGADFGVNMRRWNVGIIERVRAATDRRLVIRVKADRETKPLEEDLQGAWCVVTHSSTSAVTAVIEGIPVFCKPTCAAAAVGRTDLDIENPVYPEREAWIAALAHRQFSREEIGNGTAWARIRERAS
jgi:hypothetical protein